VAEDNLFWKAVHKVLGVPFLFRLQQNICNDYGAVRRQFEGDLQGEHLRVLDVGCSTGASVPKIFDLKRVDYTGIEIVPEYAAIAQRMNPDGKFLAMDARKMDLPDAAFDRVFFLAVWHHMDDETVTASLKEAARVLAPGGRVLVAENIFTPGKFISTLLLNHDRGKFIRSPDGYRALAQGWKIEREEIFQYALHRMFVLVLTKTGG
jgi:SAM-dependent methyltransferase